MVRSSKLLSGLSPSKIVRNRKSLLLEAWQRFESEGTGNGANLTVQQLCKKFLARQIAERRSAQTLADDRWRLNALSRLVGQARAAAVKRSDILGYLEAIPPGTNRRSHYAAHARSISNDRRQRKVENFVARDRCLKRLCSNSNF